MASKKNVDTDIDVTPSFFDGVNSKVDITNKAIQVSKLNKGEEVTKHASEVIDVFAKEAALGNLQVRKNIAQSIDERIADIDAMMTAQINAILHHPEFQKLEASWQGLHSLVKYAEPDDDLKIRVLDAKKEDILADSDAAPEFDETALFKMVYEHEYGSFGGTPYGLLIGDYSFDRGEEDMECLKAISTVAAAAHAPFIAAASPEMFNVDTFKDLHKPRDIVKLFNSPEFAPWRKFREIEDSKYVALTLPRVIMRQAYGRSGIPVKEFNFKEDLDGTKDEKYLWGSPAYSLAERMVESYRKYGWFSNIRGVENGGKVEALPYHGFKDAEGNETFKMPVETQITDRREKELDDTGFLPLIYKRGTDSAVFFGSKTLHKVPEYESDVANANAQLSVQLTYLMAISRFAHYLKVIMRDKIGSFADQNTISATLNNWINQYVVASDTATDYTKSVRPLREASVTVEPVPGKVGSYRAVMALRPHFYLNDLTIALRMVTELGSGGESEEESGE